MAETPGRDPVAGRSLSVLLLVSVFLLMLTVAWSLYDEFFGLRPWRGYQREFIGKYESYLNKQIAAAKKTEEAMTSSPEYKQLSADSQAKQAAAAPKDKEIQQQLALIEVQRAAMTPSFQTARGKVGSLVYQYEVDHTAGKLKDVNDAKAETYEFDYPDATGTPKPVKMNYDQLNALFAELMSRKADLVTEQGENDKAAKDAQDKLNDYVKEHEPGISVAALEGLRNAANTFNIDLRQVNVNPNGTMINYLGGVGLVDRCQSCHIATDTQVVPVTMTLTNADLGIKGAAPFTTHPDPDLFKWHPLQQFGCSPCHGGNGRALDSVEKAHGRYEHWLWPLTYKENMDAGCQNCHAADMVTEHATVLNKGRALYRTRGCIGCHKYQGFDDEQDRLNSLRQQITLLESTKSDYMLKIPRLNAQADAAPDNATAQRLNAEATNLTVESTKIDAQVEQLDRLSESLMREAKRVGPDLKEVRMKLRKEWIPVWLAQTHTFRPTTKMPQFRLEPNEIQAIAAFIWQQGITSGNAPAKAAPGDANHGQQLVQQRGCLACHSIGEGSNLAGGDFAANLSRIGEKENYDYVVRWVSNPRLRTRPYCPFEKKDLGPEDYAKHGLPFVFDLDHSKCPNDGHQLEVQQPTIMPSLRLTDADSRDIASFLMTQKHADATYAPADFMDDPKLAAQGKALVQHYGCAGCHEISGLEDEGRIGTELTNEGSKPTERLDFALYTEDAKRGFKLDGKTDEPRGTWYDSKGFFDHKLADPAVFDHDKYKPDPMDRLRMPKPNVTPDDINALTTFLLGSVDPQMPPEYMYKPADRRKAVQEGWWIVTKYNCIGCHQIDIGQSTALQNLSWYQGEDKANLPPVLTSEGARVNPEWLKGFLANPSLSTTDTNRNGVRSYLQVRMPTFSLSDDEIRKIVLFFEALSAQDEPYIPEKIAPLTTAEETLARDLFTNPAAPCLKCHATGDPTHDKNATAPNFLLAGSRLRSAWATRWVTDPAKIIPGTAMPSGLFHREGERWVFTGTVPAEFKSYSGDHADLMVRYLMEITPDEQRRLQGKSGGGAAAPAKSGR
ncbi:MAG TPA: c-type cytochrome [Candidatus Acidoferrales bacterium]|nr:c-type cytochrome [Candidatus Acidoferrales bacterium]